MQNMFACFSCICKIYLKYYSHVPASLPTPSNSRQPIATGHGCATLYWLANNQPDVCGRSNYIYCGTIMDLLTFCLCDLNQNLTSDQLAASFGYFNNISQEWDTIL